MKSKLTLLLIGITLTLASCGGASTSNPKDVANAFLKAMREQNLSMVKLTATDQVVKNIGQYLGSATEQSIKKDASFETVFESDEKVGNVYFERFLCGKEKKDTMILKLIQVSGKWKVAGIGQKPFRN